MSEQITIKQLRMFAKEVGIEPIGYKRTDLVKAIISRAKMTNQYSIKFMNWYKQLDDKLSDKKSKLEVFNIETYRNCEISEEDHRKKYICTFPKGDSFEFSIDIDRSAFKLEFQCIYKNEHGQGVLLYRAEPNEHLHDFWTELGNEFFKRENGYKDALRDRILNEFNFNWEGDESLDY